MQIKATWRQLTPQDGHHEGDKEQQRLTRMAGKRPWTVETEIAPATVGIKMEAPQKSENRTVSPIMETLVHPC